MRWCRLRLRSAPVVLAAAGVLFGSPPVCAQEAEQPAPPPAIIDTIVLERHDVFPPEVAEKGWFYRVMNALHVVTKPHVISEELMFLPGEPVDSAAFAESERNLRNRFIFSELSIDTVRLEDGRLSAHVYTRDAFSTKPRLSFAVASDGRLTGQFGVTEVNLVGTGSMVKLWYVREEDRDGLDVAADFRRLWASRVQAAGSFQNLSDQKKGDWRLGVPFYTSRDPNSLMYDGLRFDGRVIQYRADSATVDPDSTFWYRRANVHRIDGALAPTANVTRYLRIGVQAEIRREEFLTEKDTLGAVPDTIYGEFGAWAEYRRARFWETRYYNGFAVEDQDLSLFVRLTAKLAPGGWGYEETGIGPKISINAGRQFGQAVARLRIDANGLYNSAGLDSGRVVAKLTGGYKPGRRHASIVHFETGIQDNPPPGGEFDLGFRTPPRLWDPHAFVGTKHWRISIEHRWFTWDKLFNLVGIGFAGFFDYGGAWYEDQAKRSGGNFGIAIMTGSAISAIAQTGMLNIGYLIGPDTPSKRFRISFGSSMVF